MMKRIVHGLISLILSGGFIAGCTAVSETSNDRDVSQRQNAPSDKETREIRELLKTFSEDVGPKGEDAWRKLQASPDSQLINELEQLERNASASDRIRPQIAFVFCWIDRDCVTRVSVIEAALSKSSPYQGFYADDAESMLSRLIERGKKDLLKPLFESATWSDGALSEGLSDTFRRELQKDPEQFLSLLSPCAADTRQKVYWLTTVDGFTDNELTVLRRRLSTISKTSRAYEAARELLQALSSQKSRPQADN